MPLRTVSNEGDAEFIRSTNYGLGRVHEVRECYSAKLICMLKLIIIWEVRSITIWEVGFRFLPMQVRNFLVFGIRKTQISEVIACFELYFPRSLGTWMVRNYIRVANGHCKWYILTSRSAVSRVEKLYATHNFNPLNPELNPICYLLALLGAHHFLHVNRIRVKLLTFRRPMSYIYGAPILDVSRSHTTTQHSR